MDEGKSCPLQGRFLNRLAFFAHVDMTPDYATILEKNSDPLGALPMHAIARPFTARFVRQIEP